MWFGVQAFILNKSKFWIFLIYPISFILPSVQYPLTTLNKGTSIKTQLCCIQFPLRTSCFILNPHCTRFWHKQSERRSKLVRVRERKYVPEVKGIHWSAVNTGTHVFHDNKPSCIGAAKKLKQDLQRRRLVAAEITTTYTRNWGAPTANWGANEHVTCIRWLMASHLNLQAEKK